MLRKNKNIKKNDVKIKLIKIKKLIKNGVKKINANIIKLMELVKYVIYIYI